MAGIETCANLESATATSRPRFEYKGYSEVGVACLSGHKIGMRLAGIYCRTCSYDLRGQQTYRCPECGRSFDPADYCTFHTHIQRFRDWLIPPLRPIRPALVTVLFAAPYFLIPSIIMCGTVTSRLVAPSRNAQTIAQALIAAVADDPTSVQRLPDDLVSRVPPALSPYQQGSWFDERYDWQRWVEFQGRAILIWFALYAATMIWALPPRLRALPKFALIATLPLFIGTCFARSLAEMRWPDNYAYLQDYVYRKPDSWQVAGCDAETIILFEKTPSRRGHRLVAFRNATLGLLTEDEFQRNALQQGFAPSDFSCE